MKPELCRILFARYPALFALRHDVQHPIGYVSDTMEGIECRDGWFDLIDELCRDIETHIEAGAAPVLFRQIKQKMGKLQVRVGVTTVDMRTLLDAAQDKSLGFCEICGKPGILCDILGRIVACEQHRRCPPMASLL